MDFAQFLKKQAQVIDKRLEESLFKTSGEVAGVSPGLEKIFQKFRESSKGGKRIRGGLVLLGYQISGGKDLNKVLDAAVAYEIFQTAILGQDDVIDKSLFRRLKPSLYNSLGGDNKAISETICLSDLGFFICFKLLSALEVEDSSKISGAALQVKAISLFSQSLTQTVLGQMLDIETPFFKRGFLEKDTLKIALLKTAAYTISGPLLLGATLAGADSKILKQLKVFGDNLGVAFQIQDDILGVFGDEKLTGKPTGDDIKECKATLLISYAQKKGSNEERGILEKNYGKPEVNQKGIEAIKEIFIKTGALDYAKDQAEVYFEKARQALKGLEQGLLYSLIDFLSIRSK